MLIVKHFIYIAAAEMVADSVQNISCTSASVVEFLEQSQIRAESSGPEKWLNIEYCEF